MPISDLEALALLGGRSRDLYRPRTLADVLERERAIRQQLEPIAGPPGIRGPNELVSEPMGPPEPRQPSPAQQEELDRLSRQKWGLGAQEVMSAVMPFIKVAFSGPRITGRVDQWSARGTKRDIRRTSDTKTLRSIMETPTVTYRYKGEASSAPKRTGVIAEEAPDGMTNSEKTMVSLPAWIEHLEASVRALSRDVAALRRRQG